MNTDCKIGVVCYIGISKNDVLCVGEVISRTIKSDIECILDIERHSKALPNPKVWENNGELVTDIQSEIDWLREECNLTRDMWSNKSVSSVQKCSSFLLFDVTCMVPLFKDETEADTKDTLQIIPGKSICILQPHMSPNARRVIAGECMLFSEKIFITLDKTDRKYLNSKGVDKEQMILPTHSRHWPLCVLDCVEMLSDTGFYPGFKYYVGIQSHDMNTFIEHIRKWRGTGKLIQTVHMICETA